MRIQVKVIPKSSINLVQAELDGSLKVKLTAAPEKGKANKKLIEKISKHFDVPKSNVRIVSGVKSRKKLVEVI